MVETYLEIEKACFGVPSRRQEAFDQGDHILRFGHIVTGEDDTSSAGYAASALCFGRRDASEHRGRVPGSHAVVDIDGGFSTLWSVSHWIGAITGNATS